MIVLAHGELPLLRPVFPLQVSPAAVLHAAAVDFKAPLSVGRRSSTDMTGRPSCARREPVMTSLVFCPPRLLPLLLMIRTGSSSSSGMRLIPARVIDRCCSRMVFLIVVTVFSNKVV